METKRENEKKIISILRSEKIIISCIEINSKEKNIIGFIEKLPWKVVFLEIIWVPKWLNWMGNLPLKQWINSFILHYTILAMSKTLH